MDTRSQPPILLPKVQIPPSRLQLVSRQRLLDALDAGLHSRLTLVSAPAGYGKSTLLSEWARSCTWPLGWVTLEAGDDDFDRFLAYMVSALQVAGADTEDLEGLLGSRFSLQPMPLEALLAILVNQLPYSFERLVLVLDDYHHIESPEIHAFVSELLDHLPPNIHLVIATRTDPPLQLARLRAKGQLNEITERELRFTNEEAGAFFVRIMDLTLTGEQVAALGERTEGWVTGLQLAGISLKDRGDPSEWIDSLTGTHRYILDYLMQEVFSDLSAELQGFLLRTSILERLSPGLCDAILSEQDDSQGFCMPRPATETIESMEAANLFIIPLDSQRQWYRYHPLFAEFLMGRLESQHPQEIPDLHRLAAGWFLEHDLLSDAVAHYIAAADFEQAADLVQAQSKDMLTRGEVTTLNRWIAVLPDSAVQSRPLLAVRRAWVMLMRDPVRFYATITSQVEAIAAGFGLQSGELLTALTRSDPRSDRRAALAEFAMLQAYAGRDRRDFEDTVALFNAAYDYLPESDVLLRGFTLAGLASVYVRAGTVTRAEQAFDRAAQISLSAGSTYGYVATTDWLATMQAEQGQLHRAAETYRRAIAVLEGQGSRLLPLSGHVYVGLASVLLEWNDLEGALQQVQTGLEVGHKVRDMDALLQGYPLQARILQAQGRWEEAGQFMAQLLAIAREVSDPGCLQEAQAREAVLNLASGEIESALRWAALRGLDDAPSGQVAGALHEVEQFAFARLLMATGRPAEALQILEGMSDVQEESERQRALVECLLLQSLCQRSLGRGEGALQTLARTLLLAEPGGFTRSFIQEGASMAAMLRSAASHGHSPDFVRHLLGCFAQPDLLQEVVLDPLSDRELEVLRLIADGLTNAQIASEMVIAPSTVKTHINRIYSKLAVSTRTAAVARARRLHLIP